VGSSIGPSGSDRLVVSLVIWPGSYAIVRLEPRAPLPDWAEGRSAFVCVTRTPAETSVICEEGVVPAGVDRSGSWSMLEVAGPLEHTVVGVLASLTAALATAGIPVFVVSTFGTDYLMVPSRDLAAARGALNAAAHHVSERGT
jgi:uncharacterized protein